MTPTEAITALQSIARVTVLSLKPDDAIVIESATALDDDEAHRFRHWLGQLFPGHEVILLDAGRTLKICRVTDG